MRVLGEYKVIANTYSCSVWCNAVHWLRHYQITIAMRSLLLQCLSRYLLSSVNTGFLKIRTKFLQVRSKRVSPMRLPQTRGSLGQCVCATSMPNVCSEHEDTHKLIRSSEKVSQSGNLFTFVDYNVSQTHLLTEPFPMFYLEHLMKLLFRETTSGEHRSEAYFKNRWMSPYPSLINPLCYVGSSGRRGLGL